MGASLSDMQHGNTGNPRSRKCSHIHTIATTFTSTSLSVMTAPSSSSTPV